MKDRGDQANQRKTLEIHMEPQVRLRNARQRNGNLIFLVAYVGFVCFSNLFIFLVPYKFHCFRFGKGTFRRLQVLTNQRDQ